MAGVVVGARGEAVLVVADASTAKALGSGDLPVLGTPALFALVEAATVSALAGALVPGTTSVGVDVRLEHLAASPVGASLRAEATVTAVEGRRVRLDVEAWEGVTLVGRGSVVRAVVDRDRFLAGLAGPAG